MKITQNPISPIIIHSNRYFLHLNALIFIKYTKCVGAGKQNSFNVASSRVQWMPYIGVAGGASSEQVVVCAERGNRTSWPVRRSSTSPARAAPSNNFVWTDTALRGWWARGGGTKIRGGRVSLTRRDHSLVYIKPFFITNHWDFWFWGCRLFIVSPSYVWT